MSKNLSKKQLAVIDDLFSDQADESAILQKHNVNRNTFNRWLADENFKAELTSRIDWLNLKSQALIARYASLAAVRLVGLTESDKEETARKACLDIISLPKIFNKKTEISDRDDNGSTSDNSLDPETASVLLEALANTQK